MNWPLAIARNRTALIAIVAAIVALMGGRDGGPIARRLRNAALALLRPAEAAARRLIILSAQDVTVAPRPAPKFLSGPVPMIGSGSHHGGASPGAARLPAFRLFDRRKRFGRLFKPLAPAGIPRIRNFWGEAAPLPPVPAVAAPCNPDALVDVTGLRRRTAALERALADLPHQARRLARWRARRLPGPGGRTCSPLRLGHPPGWRRQGRRDADVVLAECHKLAVETLGLENWALDTS